MNKIKRFVLKDGRPSNEDLEKYNFKSGGSWINDDSDMYTSYIWREKDKKYQDYEISFNMCFKKVREDFNDFDNVLVLDEEFGQPYTPFYAYMDRKIESFTFLNQIISAYNTWMSGFDFLEEVDE